MRLKAVPEGAQCIEEACQVPIRNDSKVLSKWVINVTNHQLKLLQGIGGLIIIAFSLAKLVYSEKEAVFIGRCIEEAEDSDVVVTAGHALPENDGKLVQVTGHLDIDTPLVNVPYGISIRAVKLKLRVQMYQWTENKISHVDDFDDKSYHYKKVWRDKLINSSTFQDASSHRNPIAFPLESQLQVNSEVKLGSFTLSDDLKDKFRDFTEFTSSERPQSSHIKMHMGLYYHSGDIWSPAIGDLRVQFSFAGGEGTLVSVVAKQVGHELRPFVTLLGTSTSYVQEGHVSYLEMLVGEASGKMYLIWWTRGMTWVMTFLGCLLSSNALSNPKSTGALTLTVVPLPVTVVQSLGPWLLTLGLVWLAFRPQRAILMLLTSVLSTFLSTKLCRRFEQDNKKQF